MKKTSADLFRAKAVAKSLITKNKITKPPVPVIAIAEKEGLKTFSAQLEEALIISGSIDLESNQIILNEMDERETQFFTVARALGHWMLHRDELFEIPELKILYQYSLGGKQKSYYEKEASHFARHILIPEALFTEKAHLSDGALTVMFQVPDFVIRMMREEHQVDS